ncbi:MAG TPA: winged helix-turn-helix domain-containing protein [Candidatus Dormibacteraeota bacterium]|jgi:TolB-like protein/DNA-binding winged helix-turn-helix (wHTH) protein/Tfp pilus assembly protein PilF|nr:winged helix-turn-helix domain-containing protein [Candidatus Dormibacteraeota bacterium]
MAISVQQTRRLCFDVFELDIRAGELRKRGVKLHLQGQPLQVLTTLLNHAGDVVTRDELRAEIWTADTFVDFDHSLHNAIARVREVLGDSVDTPRYIETLPRRGYRFIAQVTGVELQPPRPTTQKGQSSEPPVGMKPGKSRAALAFTLLAFLAVGSVLWLARTASHGTAAAPRLRFIAVLPLDNLSGDPSQDYFVDGMTDELITDLAKVGSLRVTSRTSVMRYKGTKKGLPEIARELNVDGIVEGSVMRSGQRVRITAQLLDAPTDRHLWAETYERDLGDVMGLQSEVAAAIAQQVRAQLTPQQQVQFRSAHPVKPEAYDAYLRGRLYFTTEYTKPESLRKAQQYFEESIQNDPNFALAYAGLADTYVYLAFAGALPRDKAYLSAKGALAKALALDDSIGEAHDTLGLLSSKFDWDWDTADREFSRAIALAPSYSCAHEDRATFLALTGRRAEALAEITKIDQLDYGFSAAWTVSGTYYELRDYPALIEASKRGLLLDPKDWMQHYFLGVGYEGMGKLQEAISEYQKAIEMSDGDQGPTVSLAHAYLAVGKKAEGEKILRDLERESKSVHLSPYMIATIYAGLGQKDRAFEFLEKAYLERALDLSWFLKADPRIDSLRSDPRFQNLLRRVGLSA